MTEKEFWSLFNKARKQAEDMDEYVDAGADILQSLVEELPPAEIASFNQIFNRKYFAAYRWDLWGAAYVINGGCSDDGFMDFRAELISRGQAIYEAALQDPESLVDVEPPILGMEGWQYVASLAYEAKTGEELPEDGERHPEQPAGRHWEEDELETLYPRLSEKFD